MQPGLTTQEVADRFRIGKAKVIRWIRNGELAAVNVASIACGRPQFVVTAESVEAFEKRRTAAEIVVIKPKRSKVKDYYPD